MDGFITDYLKSIEKLVTKLSVETIEKIIDTLYTAYEEDKQIFVMGNGGSAASSSHFVCDLAKSTIMPGRKRIKAICLTDNVSLITAWANDTNYTNIFGEILANYAQPGDVLIGCTASGMSPNIINAMLIAHEMGVKTIAIVGFNGGTVKQVAQICLNVPSENITQVEDVQMLLFHLFASSLKERILREAGIPVEIVRSTTGARFILDSHS